MNYVKKEQKNNSKIYAINNTRLLLFRQTKFMRIKIVSLFIVNRVTVITSHYPKTNKRDYLEMSYFISHLIYMFTLTHRFENKIIETYLQTNKCNILF